MTTIKEQLELQDKLTRGLAKTYEKLIEFKRKKNTPLVVMQGDQIVSIKPEDFDKLKAE